MKVRALYKYVALCKIISDGVWGALMDPADKFWIFEIQSRQKKLYLLYIGFGETRVRYRIVNEKL